MNFTARELIVIYEALQELTEGDDPAPQPWRDAAWELLDRFEPLIDDEAHAEADKLNREGALLEQDG
jgi:hypothetical protein